ncbi:glycosyltransferase [bacterium]|nr:glycosyltransferase [bacterium]
MKVTYYSKYSNLGPSSRYRAFQFVESFRSAEIDFRISQLFDDRYFDILRMHEPFRTIRKIPYTLARFRERQLVARKDDSDLNVIEQQLFPYLPFAFEEKYLSRSYLFEFDDAIYITHPWKLPRLIRGARAVIAGNHTLAEYAKKFNEQVHIVPTVLDTDLFRPLPKKSSDRLILGWSGLEYNFPYVQLLSPVLEKLTQEFPVEIVILSGSRPRSFAFPFRFEKWDPFREVEQLQSFDIGLMPLRMDDWSRGKCGFKLLQYMSLEIPSVATPVGVNREIVQHGVNGFLAQDLRDWESCLSQLISDANLRESLGKAARSTVLEGYSTRVWFPKLLSIYREYSGS